ncbi:hypothetical protein ES703_22324 [subsurface metagenome]|nr:hypothetical protein [Dehalococcoidia bacterium]
MRSIIVEELIRATVAILFWMAGLWGLGEIGVLALSPLTALAISAGLSALMFSVLVVLRTRTGWKLQVTRIRYMLILILVPGAGVFIWRMVEGKVIQAAVSAAVMLFLGVLLFIVMRKRGIEW